VLGVLRVEGCPMKLSVYRLALPSVILVFGCAVAALAEESTNPARLSEQDVQAKIQYCTYCHQSSGQGIMAGANPIPRLAGQQVQYFKNQLQAFIDRRRVNVFMFKVAHSLNPDTLDALAQHFNELNPKPAGVGPSELVDAGKKIFEAGVPEANVPPCASCHGPEAKGNGMIPRLAGQLYPYIIKALENWDKERGQDPAHPDTSAVMQPIAHGLNEAQIKAVAAYVSSLE
jgi:cytochrome c553